MTATMIPPSFTSGIGPSRPPQPSRPMSDTVRTEVEKLSLDGDLVDIRQDPNISDEDFIKFLRNLMTPVRLSIRWPGTRRALTGENKSRASAAIDADMEMTDFATRLYDFKSDKWKRIKEVRQNAINLWRKMSINYPSEDGVRLIRRELIDQFTKSMREIQSELQEAAIELNERFPEILDEGKRRRGDAYHREDYPDNLLHSFSITYSFPSVECASELRKLNPQLWVAECQRVREDLDEALHRAESEYLGQLDEVIGFLVEKLEPNADGSKKMMRESSLTNIADIVETFKKVNLGSRKSVQALTTNLERVTGSTTIELLRKSEAARANIQAKLQTVRNEVQRLKIEEDAAHLKRKNIRQIHRSNPAQGAA